MKEEWDRDWTSLALQVVPTPHQLRVAPKKRPHQVSLLGFSVGNDFCNSVGLPFDLVFAVAAINAERLGLELNQAHGFVARGIGTFIGELVRNNAPAKGASDLPKQYAKYHTYEDTNKRLLVITERLRILLHECDGMQYIAHHVWAGKLFAGCDESFSHMIFEAPRHGR